VPDSGIVLILKWNGWIGYSAKSLWFSQLNCGLWTALVLLINFMFPFLQ
jgi:hypothetical protein